MLMQLHLTCRPTTAILSKERDHLMSNSSLTNSSTTHHHSHHHNPMLNHHSNGSSTSHAHLNGYAKGVEFGDHMMEGDLILQVRPAKVHVPAKSNSCSLLNQTSRQLTRNVKHSKVHNYSKQSQTIATC
jgi:hypothetical protein